MVMIMEIMFIAVIIVAILLIIQLYRECRDIDRQKDDKLPREAFKRDDDKYTDD